MREFNDLEMLSAYDFELVESSQELAALKSEKCDTFEIEDITDDCDLELEILENNENCFGFTDDGKHYIVFESSFGKYVRYEDYQDYKESL